MSYFLDFFLSSFIFIAQNRVVVDGIIVDEFDEPVPYAAVGLLKKILYRLMTKDGFIW